MDGLLPALLTVALFAVTMGGVAWLAGRVKRNGIGAGVLAPIADMWDPAPYRSQIEVEILDERKAPPPAPGDPPDKA